MIPEVWTKLAYRSPSMISGQGEALEQLCRRANDRYDDKLIWLFSDADHIYNGYPFNTKSEGFGGAKLTFRLIDDEDLITLYGPWHCNAEALFAHTGVDLRNQHLTRGLCAYGRTYDSRDGYIYLNVFHMETDWVSGSYNRIRDIARAVADKTQRLVFYYMESHGGTVHSFEGREYEKDSEDDDSCGNEC